MGIRAGNPVSLARPIGKTHNPQLLTQHGGPLIKPFSDSQFLCHVFCCLKIKDGYLLLLFTAVLSPAVLLPILVLQAALTGASVATSAFNRGMCLRLVTEEPFLRLHSPLHLVYGLLTLDSPLLLPSLLLT